MVVIMLIIMVMMMIIMMMLLLLLCLCVLYLAIECPSRLLVPPALSFRRARLLCFKLFVG
jgi:hypothetical protein